MKSCKKTLYLSILALTALPLSLRAMEDLEGTMVPTKGDNNNNPFKQEIDFDKFAKRSTVENFDDDLFNLSTDESRMAFEKELKAPLAPDNQSWSSFTSTQAGTLSTVVVATGTYALNNMGVDLLTKRGALDITTGSRIGMDPTALVQAVFSGIQVLAVPAMVYFTYTEIGDKRVLEQLAKKQKRQLEQQDQYIQRLVTGLKQHEVSAQQVVKAQYKTLGRIHGKIMPVLHIPSGKNCESCKEMIAKATIASKYVSEKMADFQGVHNDIPDLIANTDKTKVTWNPKTWFQRLREICRKHEEDENPS
jgi:hypothetical protein